MIEDFNKIDKFNYETDTSIQNIFYQKLCTKKLIIEEQRKLLELDIQNNELD